MRTQLISLVLLASGASAPLLAQSQWLEIYTRSGDEAGSSFSYAMASLADRDGDGFKEILVGAHGADLNGTNSGAAYVLHGESGATMLTIPGEGPGDLFGAAVARLSDLDLDGTQDFAVSAPYFTGSLGLFQGRVYVISGFDGSLLDVLDGSVAGHLFGTSITGTDVDGDGVLELAVGSVGANAGDGELRFFEWNAGAMTVMAGGVMAGAPGSREWFGFSAQDLGNLALGPGSEFVVGAPYANDGGARSGAVTALSSLAVLKNYAPAIAGAQVGFAVSAIRTAAGGFVAGGAPLYGSGGAVFVWNGLTTALIKQLNGSAAGGHFGAAVRFLDDRDFDSLPEVAIGAPDATAKGKGYVIDFLENPAPSILLEATGTAGSGYGSSILEVGDVNGSTIPDLAFGAPNANAGLGGRQGLFQVWTPPDTNLPPPNFGLTTALVLDSQVDMGVQFIKENADLYFYVGTSNTPSTTAEGFQIDIGGLIGGVGGKDYFELAANVTGGNHLTSWQIPISVANGTILYFQVVEERGIFVRNSNVDGGAVQDRPIELDLLGTLQVGQTVQMKVAYAHRSTSAFVYYFIGPGPGSGTYLGSIQTGLSNPIWLGTLNPDQYGSVSFSWPVPTTLGGQPLAGKTVYFSAVSWYASDQRLAVIGPYTVL